MEEIIARKYHALSGLLNERQSRLWAASESMSLGYGGISLVSRATGISRVTISRGIKELEKEQPLSPERSRRPGAGRKKGCELQPTLKPSLDAIVEPTAQGDPMSPLRWTTHSTRRLANPLRESGLRVSKTQVGQLLHEMGYHLSGNRKSLEGGTNPDRNAQFEIINAQAATFLKQGCPVISADAKKKEWIGPQTEQHY